MPEGPRPPLARTLVFTIAGVAFAAVVVTAGLTFGLVRLTAQRVTMADLRREADRAEQIASSLEGRQTRLTPRQILARAGASEIRFVPDGAPAADLALPDAPEGVTSIGDRDFYYVRRTTTLRNRSGTLVVLRPAGVAAGPIPGLGLRLLVSMAAALTSSAIASYWLGRRIARPLADLGRAARHLARGERVVLPPTQSEPAELADLRGAFVDLSDDLAASRDRERSFLLSVSHELRTPLTAIRGYGEALVDGTARGPTRAGRVIVREANRLERLVQDLLDLSRMQAGEFSVQLEDVDLATLCAEAVESLRPRAAEFGVRLDGPGRGAGAQCSTDPDRVHQLLANLIENALRVTPDGGRVQLNVEGVTVEVQDSGPGLEPEDVDHAFERFYLWRKYRGERAVGSGLGLAIVAELARLLRVRVTVDSAPSTGTRFRLAFPAPGQ